MLAIRTAKFQLLYIILLVLPVYSAIGAYLSENQLKAGYIYNFASYTQWPKSIGDELFLCVFAKSQIKVAFSELDGVKVGHRLMRIKQNIKLEQITKCHIIYIGQLEQENLGIIFKKIKNKSILTVSDISKEILHGVLITMYVKNNKIKFNVNNRLATLNQLTISSRLLRLADKVEQ